MESFKEKEYEIFKMFDKNWALVTAGTIENFNSLTISWGSLGTLWSDGKKNLPIVTLYIHPARYTSEFLKESETFTVSFFPQEYKKSLGYMGSHSGRDENKVKNSGLSPVVFQNSVTYEEANLTFLCKKIYEHQFSKENLKEEIKDYYASLPEIYPDFNGGWQPHIVFVGEIIDVRELKK